MGSGLVWGDSSRGFGVRYMVEYHSVVPAAGITLGPIGRYNAAHSTAFHISLDGSSHQPPPIDIEELP